MKILLLLSLFTCSLHLKAQTIPDEYVDFYGEIEMLPYEEKFEMLNEVLKFDPNDPWYYWMIAVTYDQMGNNEKTLESFEKALILDSNFSGAHASYARFLSNDSTKLELALEHIDKAIELEKDDYFHVDRGQILLALKRYDEALVEATYTLTLTDFDPMLADQLMIEVLLARGNKEELHKFVKENDISGNGEFLGTQFSMNLAAVYEEIGDQDKACTLYRGAAEPFLVMEEKIPDDLAGKLKKCK